MYVLRDTPSGPSSYLQVKSIRAYQARTAAGLGLGLRKNRTSELKYYSKHPLHTGNTGNGPSGPITALEYMRYLQLIYSVDPYPYPFGFEIERHRHICIDALYMKMGCMQLNP